MKLTFGAVAVVGAVLLVLSAGAREGAAAQETPAENFAEAVSCSRSVAIETGETGPWEGMAAFWIPRVAQAGVGSAIDRVWIDLSLFNNNFARGTFIGAGPFAPSEDTQRFEWLGLQPGKRHYYRLNALTPQGWREIGRGVFETPDCVNVGQFYCSPGDGSLKVHFQLPPAPRIAIDTPTGGAVVDAKEQWIDLSLFNNGFAQGTFIGAGPFPGAGDTLGFSWNGIVSARTHFWRRNVLYGSLWNPLARGSFLTPDCRGLPTPAPPSLT